MMMVALWVVVLAVSSAVVEAQGTALAKDVRGAEHVTVAPGGSLWSISAERLGPDATPQQVANGMRWIYALNRDRIGPDPSLIHPGLELVLPAAARPSANSSSSEREAAGSLSARPARVANGVAEDSAKTATRLASSRSEPGANRKDSGAVAARTSLPDVPAVDPAPAVLLSVQSTPASPVAILTTTVHSVVSAVVVEPLAGSRRALGLAIIALTMLTGLLMAWKLPMDRGVGYSERWRMPATYTPVARPVAAGRAIHLTDHPNRDTPSRRPELPGRRPKGSAHRVLPAGNGPGRTGLVGVSRGKRISRKKKAGRVRAPRSRRLPRVGLATGVHNPEVRRYVRRASGAGRQRAGPAARTGRR